MVKNTFILLVVISLYSGLNAQTKYVKPESPRMEKVIDLDWTFNYFPEKDVDNKGFELPGFDDAKWSVVALPHTWMTYETTGELHPYIKNASPNDNPYWWDGWGIYRKRMVIGREFSAKKIFIEFDAVQKYSRIYLNGKYIGDHKGGYTSFYFDLTSAVKFGEENVLVVEVNNTMKDKFRIPPMSAGNFDVYGGITRDVRLVIKEKIYVPYQGSYKHEGGTFVFTPKVTPEKGEITAITFLKNELETNRKVKIKTIVTDHENIIVQEKESVQVINPGTISKIIQQAGSVKNPHLWSPETPYVYNVYTEIYDGEKLMDTYYSPLGFRWFYWDYTTNKLHLNGKEVHIHGQNRHEEYIWLGGAFPKWIAERDMKDIRFGLEHNFMRTAHYPQDPMIYDFTDRNGIFIDEEVPNIKNQEFNDEVQEQNLREMIRRDRNHPSIFFWSMGNETTDAANSLWAHQEDTTRIITSRHVYNNSMGDYAPHSEKNMAIEDFLRCTIKGWYDKDERNLEPEDNQYTGTEVNDVNRSLQKNVQTHYGSVWLYADHGADREYVNSPLKHINPKGWVDSWRNPKYKYYLWQANFAAKPMVFIQYHFWREKYLGQKKNFMVHSNCEEVELFVNGKSQGKKQTNAGNQFTVVFEGIQVEKGTLEARGTKKDGTYVSNIVEMAGAPYKVKLHPSHKTSMAALNSIVEIKADITDSKGIHVIGANSPLKWEVSGPATLIGPDLYITDRDRNEEVEGTMYIDVPVTNLIRSTGQPGNVTVTVISGNLIKGETEVAFTEYSNPSLVKGIVEPSLKMDGREPVKHNLNQVSRIIAPQEMKEFAGELNFGTENIREKLKDFILQKNPDLDDQTPEFDYMLRVFTQMMQANNGRLVADDYNFTVEQYNISREITRFVDLQKLSPAFQMELKRYYAGNLVLKGRYKNFIFQKEMISKLPEGGKAVVVNAENKSAANVVYTEETDLAKLVQQVFPVIADFTKEEIHKALSLIVNVNPYVTSTRTRNRETKVYTYYYHIEPGKTILIPDPDTLKTLDFPEDIF